MFIKTPLGLIFCVAVPLLLLLVFEVINLIKLSRAEDDDEDEAASEEDKLPSYMRLDTINELKNAESTVSGANYPRAPLPLDETNITEEIVSKLKNNPLFEEVHEALEVVAPRGPFQTLSYNKPPVLEQDVHKSSIYSTKEWSLPLVERESPVAEVIPTAPIRTASAQDSIVMPAKANKGNDFAANIGGDTKNHFNIEGIDVKVLANAVKLSLDEGQKNRDISITVTNEYTNVIIDSEDYEVNFALFKDTSDKEQKVIIQKKSKAEHRLG